MDSLIDSAVLRHLDTWLERAFADDVRAEAAALMLDLVRQDEQYWLWRKWSEIARESGADRLR